MKTYHYIFITTALFVILFYDQSAGLNLGILSIVYAVLTLYRTPEENRTTTFMVIFTAAVLSGIAFGWYGDFASFLAVLSSLLLLGYRSKNRRMKILLLIPVMITNAFTSICRVFSFDEWIPKRSVSGVWQKTLAFVLIPSVFIAVFFWIYSAGSDHFASIFRDYEFDLNIWQVIILSALGFFIAFNYWNHTVEKLIYKQNHRLDNHFKNTDMILKPTYSFLDLDAERTSGVISLFALNILLLFFIVTYNYEQFYETAKTPGQLSDETHERVNAVIISIIMAILVIMFYFKSTFNFDPRARLLKIIAKVWIVLNAVLIFSAILKNSEYIVSYGFTYKRLGVYGFLFISLIGLILTYIKIHTKKRNAFLFNTMPWFLYGTILACSYINWGGIITSQNMKRKDFDLNYHLTSVNFSEKSLLKYADEKQNVPLKNSIQERADKESSQAFLSKVLYYETF